MEAPSQVIALDKQSLNQAVHQRQGLWASTFALQRATIPGMARTTAADQQRSQEHVRVLASGPVPEVDLSGTAVGARIPAGADGQAQAIFAGAENPAPQGVAERERADRPDANKEATAPPVQKLVVANRDPKGKRVNLRSPGNATGGTGCTLRFGKVVDSLNYDFRELRQQGVVLVPEEKFAEIA